MWVVNDKGSCILMLSNPDVNGSEVNSYFYENELFFPIIAFELILAVSSIKLHSQDLFLAQLL